MPAVAFGSVHPSDVLDMPVDPNEPTYCLCHQVSYGEMIGCDNPDVRAILLQMGALRGVKGVGPGGEGVPPGSEYCSRTGGGRGRQPGGGGCGLIKNAPKVME